MSSYDAWGFHHASSYIRGSAEPTPARQPTIGEIALPAVPLPAVLERALRRRASCRRFADGPLLLPDVAGILHAEYGQLGEAAVDGVVFGHRPVPSAGATYPLRLHVAARAVTDLQPGIYPFDPHARSLIAVGHRPDNLTMSTLVLDQPYVAAATAILVVSGELQRTMDRYGGRGYRYVLYEAGHVMQNVTVCAAHAGLGSVVLGGFLDAQLAALLRLEPQVVPLYAVALGHPTGEDPDEMRSPEPVD